MPTHTVDLSGHYDEFVNQLVTFGRFSSPSEVVRAGLSLLEQQAREEEEKLAALRSMAAEGFDALDRGEGIALNGEQELADFISAAGRRAAAAVEQLRGRRLIMPRYIILPLASQCLTRRRRGAKRTCSNGPSNSLRLRALA